MTLVVAARYLDLPQVHVAASALRSAGLHPLVFDEHHCSMRWTMMLGLGGCRLVVPGDELEDAVEILGYPPAAAPDDDVSTPSLPVAWRWIAGALGLGLMWPDIGWAIIGLGYRRRSMAETSVAALLSAAIVFVLLIFIEVMGLFLSNLLAHPDAPACVGCT